MCSPAQCYFPINTSRQRWNSVTEEHPSEMTAILEKNFEHITSSSECHRNTAFLVHNTTLTDAAELMAPFYHTDRKQFRKLQQHSSSHLVVLAFFCFISIHREHRRGQTGLFLLQNAFIAVFYSLFVSCDFHFQHVERRWHLTHVQVHGLSLEYHPLTFALLEARGLIIRWCNCRRKAAQLTGLRDFSNLNTKLLKNACGRKGITNIPLVLNEVLSLYNNHLKQFTQASR